MPSDHRKEKKESIRSSKSSSGGRNQQGVSGGQALEGRKGEASKSAERWSGTPAVKEGRKDNGNAGKANRQSTKMRRKSSSLCVFRPSIPSPRPYKHSMWWPKKTIDGNRLLSRGEELRLGCPAPGLVTGVLSWGAQARIEGSPTGFAPGRPFSLT